MKKNWKAYEKNLINRMESRDVKKEISYLCLIKKGIRNKIKSKTIRRC